MKAFLLSLALIAPLAAGPYPPAAGSVGTDAIAKDDPRFVQWVTGHLDLQYGSDVDSTWRTPAKAYGPATDNYADIVCLGDAGRITLYFPHPIADGAGADFAVFENSFSNTFLELAFVEVSSDGVNFFRFANDSRTASAVGAFGTIDPTNLSGLAGKYRGGYGTPFDLASLTVSPLLDVKNVRFVRLVDILGNGTVTDSQGDPIYDPYPVIGSAGFDLDAIGVIHRNAGDFPITRGEKSGSTFILAWESNPGSSYRVETGTGLGDWQPLETLAGRNDRGITERSYPTGGSDRRFWRVVRTN
jgi:hypothetical protein